VCGDQHTKGFHIPSFGLGDKFSFCGNSHSRFVVIDTGTGGLVGLSFQICQCRMKRDHRIMHLEANVIGRCEIVQCDVVICQTTVGTPEFKRTPFFPAVAPVCCSA
jgi:hypothetical protein